MREAPYEGDLRERIAVNRRKSLFLIAAFRVRAVFGYVIGYAWIGDPHGPLFGLGLAFVVGISPASPPTTEAMGGAARLAAREITHDEAPVLFNVVEEMA